MRGRHVVNRNSEAARLIFIDVNYYGLILDLAIALMKDPPSRLLSMFACATPCAHSSRVLRFASLSSLTLLNSLTHSNRFRELVEINEYAFTL